MGGVERYSGRRRLWWFEISGDICENMSGVGDMEGRYVY